MKNQLPDAASRYARLPVDELRRLIPLAQTGDEAATVRILDSASTTIQKRVRQFSKKWKYSVERDDFLQECRSGVLEAIRRCDLTKVDRFYHYADFWCRSYCQTITRKQSFVGVAPIGESVA